MNCLPTRERPELAASIMEDGLSLYKGKRVVIWLRFGYTFSKKTRVGYDLAKECVLSKTGTYEV